MLKICLWKLTDMFFPSFYKSKRCSFSNSPVSKPMFVTAYKTSSSRLFSANVLHVNHPHKNFIELLIKIRMMMFFRKQELFFLSLIFILSPSREKYFCPLTSFMSSEWDSGIWGLLISYLGSMCTASMRRNKREELFGILSGPECSNPGWQ